MKSHSITALLRLSSILMFCFSTLTFWAQSDISYFKSYGSGTGEQGNVVKVLGNGNIATGLQLANPLGGGQVYPGLLITDEAGEKITCKKYTSIEHPNVTYHLTPNSEGFLLGGIRWLMQTDSLGEVIWFKENGLETSMSILDIDAQEDAYLLVGTTYSPSGSTEIICVKIDLNANVIWSKRIETDNYQFRKIKILNTSNGITIAGTGKLGTFFLTTFLMQLNEEAEVLWTKNFQSEFDFELGGFLQDENQNFFLFGRTYSIDTDWDIFLIKTDSQGELLNSRLLDGGQNESTRCGTLLANGSLVLSFDQGGSSSRSPSVVSFQTSNLDINWSKTYLYESQFTNYVLDIAPMPNNGLLMVGDMHVTGRIRDTYLLRTLPNGEAGCGTFDYPLVEVNVELLTSNSESYSVDQNMYFTETTLEAEEAFEITEFTVCEHIPPHAGFNSAIQSTEACESVCFEFTDRSLFDPTEWNWTFENGIPNTYNGSNPPAICWTDSGIHEVQLTVSSSDGEHSLIDWVSVDLYCPPTIPNVFSPNNDRVNDAFEIINLPEKFLLKIYSRWGNQVFSSSKKNRVWKGENELNGKDLSEGVYYYDLQDFDSKQHFKGYVHLTR